MGKNQLKSLVNKRSKVFALKVLITAKSKLRVKGSNCVYTTLRMRNYLKPESRLNQEEMKVVLLSRLGMSDVPKNHPYHYGSSKYCRFGCAIVEDITHAVSCVKDGIYKNMKNELIENIFIDNIKYKDKEELQ